MIFDSFNNQLNLIPLVALVAVLLHKSTKVVFPVSAGHRQTTSFLHAPTHQAAAIIGGRKSGLSLGFECERSGRFDLYGTKYFTTLVQKENLNDYDGSFSFSIHKTIFQKISIVFLLNNQISSSERGKNS